ncbi:MAG: hypothetical protein PWP03_276 [Candidatus Woesearchaeota archaeon]|nr:hypothetical protein [Candidatus Woesearchaeota archaeon]MDN5327638.1 hypothetical protein [Candidatus Woesearchaeota archaeon]
MGKIKHSTKHRFQETFIKNLNHIVYKIKRAEFVGFGFFILFFLSFFLLTSTLIVIINSRLPYAYIICNKNINREFVKSTTLFLSSNVTNINESEYLQQLTVKEALHMLDVKTLMNKLLLFSSSLLLVLAVLVLILVFTNRITTNRIINETFKKGFVVSLLIFAVFILTVALGFSLFFETFHRIFFPQGNYTFPRNSILILNLPQSFFLKFLILSITEALALDTLFFTIVLKLNTIIRK